MKKEKINTLEKNIKKLEEDSKANNSHNHFKSVKDLEGKPRKCLMTVKDKDGKKKTNMKDVLRIWKDHFKKHLNTAFPYDENALNSIPEPLLEDNELFEISKDQIRKAIKALKTRKSPGNDGITAKPSKQEERKWLIFWIRSSEKCLHETHPPNGQRC